MERYTHIVWDFNGTIFDDVDACFRSANALLSAHGLKPLESLDAYREVFGFPIIEYYRRLGFDFSVCSYAELAVEWVALYKAFSAASSIYPQIPTVTDAFRHLGKQQLILSATQLQMLEEQVSSLGIRDRFDELLGLDNIHAYSKTALAVSWRKHNPSARVLFLGDTEHDLDAARAMRADCILVASGHRPKAALERCGALAVVDDLSGLTEVFPSMTRPQAFAEPSDGI